MSSIDAPSMTAAQSSMQPPPAPAASAGAASTDAALRRARVRALVLAAAKARAQQALTLADEPATPLFAPFSPSPLRVVHAVWDFLDARADTPALAPHELLVDLGCGDARWLIAGVERYTCRALGIEIDAALVATAQRAVADRALTDRIDIVQDDILRVDISTAALVIVYAFAESLHGIRSHLETHLSSHARVLSIGVRPLALVHLCLCLYRFACSV